LTLIFKVSLKSEQDVNREATYRSINLLISKIESKTPEPEPERILEPF
jgi:hypothetical protein